jgi:hypothetical protein
MDREKASTHDIAYANILAHEIFYLDLYDSYDDPFAEPGTIGSGQSSRSTPVTIPKKMADYINDKLDAESE